MYFLAINQALPYGCSFVTYGHPEGSAAGDITIIWNDVKQSVDCAHPFPSSFTFFCHHHHMECLLFSDLRTFSLSFPLCEWFSSTPFLSLVYYIYVYVLVLSLVIYSLSKILTLHGLLESPNMRKCYQLLVCCALTIKKLSV